MLLTIKKELPVHLNRQSAEFIQKAKWLVIAMDCASFKSYKISGTLSCRKNQTKTDIGVALLNEAGDYHLLNLCRSLNKTGLDLYQQVLSKIESSPLPDEIKRKTRFLMTDQGTINAKLDCFKAF